MFRLSDSDTSTSDGQTTLEDQIKEIQEKHHSQQQQHRRITDDSDDTQDSDIHQIHFQSNDDENSPLNSNDSQQGLENGQEISQDESLPQIIDFYNMNVKQRQKLLNDLHPFGLRVWKSDLDYDVSNSFDMIASLNDVHQLPITQKGRVHFLNILLNLFWTLLFGWWMSILYFIVGVLMTCTYIGRDIGKMMISLSIYVFYPFGKMVIREREETSSSLVRNDYSFSDYEMVNLKMEQSDDLNQNRYFTPSKSSINIFAKIIFYFLYVFTIVPCHLIVSALCWVVVITIPTAKINLVLVANVLKSPHNLSVHSSQSGETPQRGEVILCSYKGVNMKYFKCNIWGINIMIANMVLFVLYSILDGYLLPIILERERGYAHPLIIFLTSYLAMIPLIVFIKTAIVTICLQASLVFGAVVNAVFGSLIEIILFSIALSENKIALVSYMLIGSIAGTLIFLIGLSMMVGGAKRREQRLHSDIIGVPVISVFMGVAILMTPTLIYKGIQEEPEEVLPTEEPLTLNSDPAYTKHVKPLIYFIVAVLPALYGFGLFYTLKSSVKTIKRNKNVPPLKTRAAFGSLAKAYITVAISTVAFWMISNLFIVNMDEFMAISHVPEPLIGLQMIPMILSLTERVNSFQFAMRNDMTLSVEVGLEYAVQIVLLQVPFIFIISSIYSVVKEKGGQFSMIFSWWDIMALSLSIISIVLVKIEGRTNYFIGGVLLVLYGVIMIAFFISPQQFTIPPI